MRAIATWLLLGGVFTTALAEPGPLFSGDYLLGITNTMAHPIEVSYARGDSLSTLHDLGAVVPAGRRVFHIPNNGTPTVSVSAEGMDGTPMGAQVLTLKADSIVDVKF